MGENKNNINDEIFEALLIPASKESLRREMEKLPSPEELEKLCPVSDALNKRIMNIIDDHEKAYKKKWMIKRFSKIASAFAILSVIGGTILMSVEASRNFIRNSMISVREDHVSFEFGQNIVSDISYNVNSNRFILGYIPDGFELTDSTELQRIFMVTYYNDIGERIIISRHEPEATSVSVDNELREFSTTYINGQKFHIFEALYDDIENTLLWQSGENVFDIISIISLEEILKIAENLSFE